MAHRLRSELPLILPAIFIAFVIWLIAKQGDLEDDTIPVHVQLADVPQNFEVAVDPPEVNLKVRFPQDQASNIVAKRFAVTVSVRNLFESADKWDSPTAPQEKQYVLDLRHDLATDVPRSVQIVSTSPDSVRLTATLRTRMADIKVNLTGSLPGNNDFIAPPAADPVQALVTGSIEALRNLEESQKGQIETQPIILSNIRDSSVVYRQLIIPPGLVLLQPKDKTISISLGVSEKATTRTLSQVPVSIFTVSPGITARITPKTVNIELTGPPSALDRIKVEDFVFRPTKDLDEQSRRSQEVGLEIKFNPRVPMDVARNVRIVQWTPPRIAVEFVPTTAQTEAGSTTGSAGKSTGAPQR